MKLRFLGKDSLGTYSPTLYASDQDSYVIQGWIVTDAALLAQLTIPDGETLVEVPATLLNHLLNHLTLDGVQGVW